MLILEIINYSPDMTVKSIKKTIYVIHGDFHCSPHKKKYTAEGDFPAMSWKISRKHAEVPGGVSFR